MSGKSQNAAALVSTLAVTALVKKLVDAIWKLGSKGKEPPTDPSDPDITMQEAVVFAILSGAALGVVRMFLARRFAKSERREARVQRAVGNA